MEVSYPVFIAFAESDGLELARQLRAALAALGVDAFVANDCAQAGGFWDQSIREAHLGADLTVVVLTRELPCRPHPMSEVHRALRWFKDRSHRVVPWPQDGATDRDLWPSGLEAFQAVEGAAELVAAKVRDLLRPVSSPAVTPSPAALDAAAEWLTARFPTPAARRALFRSTAFAGREQHAWAELVRAAPMHQVVAWLRENEDNAGETAGLIAELERSASVAPGAGTFDDKLQALLDRGVEALKSGQPTRALDRFQELEKLIEGDVGQAEFRARALLNQVAALLALGRHGEIAPLLELVDPSVLSSARARENYGRFLVAAEQWEKAQTVADDLPVVGQLLTLRRDRRLPDGDLVDDVDVRLSAAILHVNEGRSETGIQLALAVLNDPDLVVDGRRLVAEILGRALYRSWVGLSAEQVSDPAGVLARFRELLNGHEEEWGEVELLRSLIDLDPPRPAEGSDPDEQVPPWVIELRSISRAEEVEPIALRYPGVPAVQFELARAWRTLGEPARGLPVARRTFATLPGRGQRLELCRCLLAADQRQEARLLFEGIERERDEDWELFVGLSVDGEEWVERATAWTQARPSDFAWFSLARAEMSQGQVEEARRAVRRMHNTTYRGLSLEALELLAAVATGGGLELDRDLARGVAEALREDHADDARGQLVRLHLLMALGDKDAPPVDFALLEQAGLAWKVTQDDLIRQVQQHRVVGQVRDRLWAAGGICFESWAVDAPMGSVGLAFDRCELAVPPPLRTSPPAAWQGRRCLVGALAVELLVALDLHQQFGERVAQVVVLADVWERVMNGPDVVSQVVWAREVEDTARLWAPVEGLPTVDAAPVPIDDAPRIRAWLGSLGRLPAQAGELWRPPAGVVVLDDGLIYALGADLEPFLRACQEEGIPLAVSQQARRSRSGRAQEIRRQAQVLRIASTATRWFQKLRSGGKLTVLPVPDPPALPPLRSPSSAVVRLGNRAWASREALHAEADLVLVAAELSEWGVDGHIPLAMLETRQWTPEVLDAIRQRYASASGRTTTVDRVLRELAPPDKVLDVVERLASAGYVDALQGEDLLALFERYQTLQSGRPWEILRRVVRTAAGPDRLPHHSLVAQAVGMRLFSQLCGRIWLHGEPPPNAELVTRSALELAIRLDRESRWRLGILRLAIVGLVIESVSRPRAFIQGEEDGMAMVGTQSVAAHMWRYVAGSLMGEVHTRAALFEGVAYAFRMVSQQDSPLRDGLVQTILWCLPAEDRSVDLSSTPWVVALTSTPPMVSLDESLEDHPIRAWLDGLIAAQRWTLDQLALSAPVSLTAPDRTSVVRAPVEVLVDRMEDAHIEELAYSVGPHDGRLEQALAVWRSDRNAGTWRSLLDALFRSPIRSVRADPRTILTWSIWQRGHLTPVASLSDLRSVLSLTLEVETDPTESPYLRWLSAIVDRGASALLLRQLGRIPGAAVGSGARGLMGQAGRLSALARESVRLIEHHRSVDAGALCDAVVALAIAGEQDRVQRVGDRDFELPRLAAELASAALMSPPTTSTAPDHSLATLEPALVRLCGSVVLELQGPVPLPLHDWTWWSWRLFGWLVDQLRLHEDPAAILDLAAAAPDPIDPDQAPGDLYSPHRLAPGRVDLRELMILQALHAVRQWDQNPAARVKVAVDWQVVVPAVDRIAARELTPDEVALRPIWTESVLGGPALCAPDLARLLLLELDRAWPSRLSAEQRLRWLDDAFASGPPGSALARLRDLVLLSFVLDPDRLSGAEKELLVHGLEDPSFVLGSAARRVAVVVGAGIEPGLLGRAHEALHQGVTGADAVELAGIWFLVQADLDRLSQGVGELRGIAAEHAVDPQPLLQALARVVASPHRARAVGVLEELCREPALEVGLGALLRYARGEEVNP